MKKLAMNPAQVLFAKFCEAYKKRHLPDILNLFSQNINMWGSGIDEYRVGLKEVSEQLQRDFSQSEKAEIEVVSFVPVAANAPWAAAQCTAKITLNGTEHLFEHLRGTVIVEKEKGEWKISHMHASFPDYRNAENASFPLEG